MPNTLTNRDLVTVVGLTYDPVRTIQPFGYLFAFHKDTGTIEYVSDNIEALIATSAKDVLGQNAATLLGDDIWHALFNTQSVLDGINRRDPVGHFDLGGHPCKLHAFFNGTCIVVEIEPTSQAPALADDFTDTLRFMTDRLHACSSEIDLLATATTLLRRATGFDQAIACRIEADGTGSIIADAHKSSDDAFLGLHLTLNPKLPDDTSARIPVQFIANVDGDTFDLHANSPRLPPLDVSQAHVKGMSTDQRASLIALGIKSMFSWPIYHDGTCWGSVAAISRRRMLPSLGVRQTLHVVMSILETKLAMLRQQKTLTMWEKIETIVNSEQSAILNDTTTDVTLTPMLLRLLQLFEADGAILWAGQEISKVGQTPTNTFVAALTRRVLLHHDPVLCINHMADDLGHRAETSNGLANCMAVRLPDGRIILLFRHAHQTKTVWAEETIPTLTNTENVNSRPNDDYTFSEHTVSDHAPIWSTQDQMLANRLWGLVALADHQAVLNQG